MIKNKSKGMRAFSHSLDRKNIYLTGFMGAGKTTTGKLLAANLKRKFLDTDQLVEKKMNLSITQIFKDHGEAFFRDLESEVLESLSDHQPGNLVIATGGGVVLRKNNRFLLKQNGLVIFLKAAPEELYHRIKSENLRPLLAGPDPAQSIMEMLAQREDFYRDCHLEIDTTAKVPETVVSEILFKLHNLDA